MRDTSIASFLDDLSAPAMRAGPGSAVALVGAVAAALAAAGTKLTSSSTSGTGEDLVGEAEAVRRRLEDLMDSAPAGSPQTVAKSLVQTAEQGAAIISVVLRTLPQTPPASHDAVAALVTAAALSRAMVEGAVQYVLASLPAVDDDLSRTALKTRAQGLSQRARQAEADLLRVMVSHGRT